MENVSIKYYTDVPELDEATANNGNYLEVNITGSIMVYGRLFNKKRIIGMMNNYHHHTHEEIQRFLYRFGFRVKHTWVK